MRFYAVGLNHECASLDQTEAFALDEEAQAELYQDLTLSEDGEVVVLSTCHRTEAFLYGTDTDVHRVEAALGRAAGQPWPEQMAFRRRDESAVRHLLEVTSGLRSMVPGDNQILAQVKTAYERAVDAGVVHSLMHRLLHTAFRAAKRVSAETNLSRGAASVSTAALEMAQQYLAAHEEAGPLEEASVVLVGTGDMGQLALEALVEEPHGALAVTNRSPDRAQEVAGEYDGEPVEWSHRHEIAARADLVLVASGAPEPVLTRSELPASSEAAPTLIVDIARPRNVEPAIADRPGYVVFTLDDLQAWTEEVRERRAAAVPEAESICEELLDDFVTWAFHQQALQPAIQAIRQTFDTIREQEVERHAHRTDMDRAEVERLTKSIMQKLLAVPIVRLKNVDPDSIDFVQGIELLHALFAPSDGEGPARSLPVTSEADTPSLGEAPSRCPYLTHEPTSDGAETERVRQALRRPELSEGDAPTRRSPQSSSTDE